MIGKPSRQPAPTPPAPAHIKCIVVLTPAIVNGQLVHIHTDEPATGRKATNSLFGAGQPQPPASVPTRSHTTESVRDVIGLTILPPSKPTKVEGIGQDSTVVQTTPKSSPDSATIESRIIVVLADGRALGANEIVRRVRARRGEVKAALAALEAAGRVQMQPGGRGSKNYRLVGHVE